MRAFAKELDLEPTTYQYYEGGYKKDILPLELTLKVRALARRHGIENTLDVHLTPLHHLMVDGPFVMAPLISWVQAGTQRESWDMPPEEFLPIPLSRDAVFCLRVQGNSMSRHAPEGSIVAVDPADRDPVDGKFYVATIEGESTFKRFRDNPPRLESDSLEESHETYFGEFELIGRVVYVLNKV